MAQVALAWMLAKPEVATPIIGATKLSQLEDTVGALDVTLDDAQIKRLEAPYRSQRVKGMFGLDRSGLSLTLN